MKTPVAGIAPAAEPEFLLAVQRALRAPGDRLAILVHLSRLREARAPMPPPHQLHLARSILQDAAQRFEGQVFNLRNGDLALLCRGAGRPADAPGTLAVDPSALPGIMGRLFHADMAKLVSVWPLTTQGTALLGYAADRLAEAPPATAPAAAHVRPPKAAGRTATAARSPIAGPLAAPMGGPMAGPVAGPMAGPMAGQVAGPPGAPTDAATIETIESIIALLAGTRVSELMHRHTAVRLRPSDLTQPATTAPDAGGETGLDDRGAQGPPPAAAGFLLPVFRELTFSIAALEARVAGPTPRSPARSDPFLFRHLLGHLDARMLTALLAEIGSRSPLDIAAASGQPPLHLNLTLPTILGEFYARLAGACQTRGIRLGIEVSYAEACADPAGFRRASDLLKDSGTLLALDGVDAAALALTRPWRLPADLVKLEWSARLATEDGHASAEIVRVLDRIGPQAVVLTEADTNVALAWGMARGIELFQGRQVDAMLGGRRMSVCSLAGGCTTRQCIDRAAALSPAGRSGCGNTALLDTNRTDTGEEPRPGGAQPGSPKWHAGAA